MGFIYGRFPTRTVVQFIVPDDKLFKVSDAETHFALILLRLMGCEFANGMTTSQLTPMPTGLTLAVSQQTALTNLIRGENLLFGKDN
jgi:hypothetical protein